MSELNKKISEQEVELDTTEFDPVLEKVLEGKSILITGNAGTGKSTLLNYIRDQVDKELMVLAPTGVAAVNVDGATIHSTFRFPIDFLHEENIEIHGYKTQVFKAVDILVIDEISMVRADLLDAIDYALREYRKSKKPFGGVQVLMFGDPLQLSPIVDKNLSEIFPQFYESPYFFSSRVWQEADIEHVNLERIFRQDDQRFVEILNKVRMNEAGDLEFKDLNKRVGEMKGKYLTLTATKAVASRINTQNMNKLRKKQYSYYGDVWNFRDSECPTDPVLTLSEGAQVMMLVNDKDKRWVNGTIATISKLDHGRIWVEVNGVEHEVEEYVWKKSSYEFDPVEKRIEQETTGRFKQFPLKPAWAITIHKSQGKTFDRVKIDLGTGSLAPGQTYVALSRCRSLEGISLAKPINPSDVIVDPKVVRFLEGR